MAVPPEQRRRSSLDDLKGMIKPPASDWSSLLASNESLRSSTTDRDVRLYYEKQAEQLESFVEVDAILASSLPRDVLHTFMRHEPHSLLPEGYGTLERQTSHSHGNEGHGEEERLLGGGGEDQDQGTASERKQRVDAWGLNLNIAVNLLLFATKGVAALASNSISILASFIDSGLDVLSTFIVWVTSRAATGKRRSSGFPVGKKRFEPLGILVFSVLQIATFSQVFVESITRLVNKDDSNDVVHLSWFGKGVILFTIAIKFFIWAVTRKMESSGVAALAQDAINDVYFNTASLLFPWLGSQLNLRQLDPVGGACLSVYVIVQWCRTLFENFMNLSGRVASEREFSRVLYLVSRFEKVEHISSLEVYHGGDELLVEVDVCLPPDTSLHLAHDIGEVMQTSIEALSNVARAFVHLDYSASNPQAHLSKDEQEELHARSLGWEARVGSH